MKAFFDDRQWQHDPQHFLSLGVARPSPEHPERINRLLAGAKAAGCEMRAPSDAGLAPLAAVHTPDYLDFLRTIHGRWQQMEGAGPEVIPNVHPRRRIDSYTTSPVGQAGHHQADTACPIGEHTWEAAYWSAQCAIAGADVICEGEWTTYALCRPPGHHAFGDQAGGFCFLNNAGIAAQRLLETGHRPAILDVDVHHGNGTQGMFYDRSDVLTVSLHTDPDGFYPFFWGHAQERGEGAGLGYNLNLPLTRGIQDDAYLGALETALERVQTFGCTALIVALGLDAHESDPFQGMGLSTPGFARIGTAIAGLGLPTLLVQEGGYLSDVMGENLTSVLDVFARA